MRPSLQGWQLRVRGKQLNCPAHDSLARAERGLHNDLQRLLEQSLGYRPRWLALKVLALLRVRGWGRRA